MQEAFSLLYNEIREYDRHYLSQLPIYSLSLSILMAVALKDRKVTKPQPKKVLTYSLKGKNIAIYKPQKSVRFNELPGHDKPGDLSKISFPEIIISSDDSG